MGIAATLLLVWLGLWAAGETPVGRFLRSALVDLPARRLGRVTPGQLIVTIGLMLAVAGFVHLFEREAFHILTAAAPEVIG